MLKFFVKKLYNKVRGFVKGPKIIYISNIFEKSNDKNVLISYITSPFKNGLKYSHTSSNECMIICKVFSELGYNVDIVDFDALDFKIDYSKYGVIFGFGHPLENSYYHIDLKNTKTIYYG